MSRSRRPENLRRILRDCLVQVNQDPEYGGGGSGFFAAPGYVITCSHVIHGPDDDRRTGLAVSGFWGSEPWSGEVIFASPPPSYGERADGGIWPLPDIAVIRLTDPPSHPCVRLARYRLDDDEPDSPRTGRKMHAAVRQAPLGGAPDYLPLDDITYQGPHRGLLRLTGDRFLPGMSGGPVLDPRTGKVCAMLKTAAPDGECCYAIPLGDLRDLLPPEIAAPLLRQHDRFHHENQRWVEAQEPLWERLDSEQSDIAQDTPPAPLLRPREEAEILRLLADLPARNAGLDAEQYRLYELYDQAVDSFLRPDPGELRDLRDLIFRLCEQLFSRDSVHPIIRFAELLAARLTQADAEYAATLRDWSTAVAARMGVLRHLLTSLRAQLRAVGAGDDGRDAMRSLIIKLEPFNPPPQPSPALLDKYLLTVMAYRSDTNGRIVLEDRRPYTIDEAVAAMRPTAYRTIRDLGGPRVVVELVLPSYLFDVPAHLWRFIEPPYAPPRHDGAAPVESPALGQLHPIVVRELDRFGDDEYKNQHGPWWDWLSALPGVPLAWIGCDDAVTVAELSARLAAPPFPRACLGMAGPAGRPPGYALMDRVLAAGMPVAVWRRVPCKEHSERIAAGNGPCEGELFRSAVEPMIAETPLYRLPHTTMLARNRNGKLGTEELVLLWDNPRRGPLPSRLEFS